MENLLKETKILDFNHPSIQNLIKEREWKDMELKEQVSGIYNFVKDDIPFGYNDTDDIPASEVLADGFGQCNTKSTLFMALLRAVGVSCRIHGFTINKELQKGAISGVWYLLAPKKNLLHSWVEVDYNGKWLNIEGFILDNKYLKSLQAKFPKAEGSFCGYGAAVKDFKNPPVVWNECDTYIQSEEIDKDFGLFDSPDEFYAKHPNNIRRLPAWKSFLAKHFVLRSMNRNVRRIREGGVGGV